MMSIRIETPCIPTVDFMSDAPMHWLVQCWRTIWAVWHAWDGCLAMRTVLSTGDVTSQDLHGAPGDVFEFASHHVRVCVDASGIR